MEMEQSWDLNPHVGWEVCNRYGGHPLEEPSNRILADGNVRSRRAPQGPSQASGQPRVGTGQHAERAAMQIPQVGVMAPSPSLDSKSPQPGRALEATGHSFLHGPSLLPCPHLKAQSLPVLGIWGLAG